MIAIVSPGRGTTASGHSRHVARDAVGVSPTSRFAGIAVQRARADLRAHASAVSAAGRGRPTSRGRGRRAGCGRSAECAELLGRLAAAPRSAAVGASAPSSSSGRRLGGAVGRLRGVAAGAQAADRRDRHDDANTMQEAEPPHGPDRRGERRPCGHLAQRVVTGAWAHIYVTGHRNPDTDSIASAIGYAELKGRLDRGNTYEPVRLGELNAQTSWVLERSGAPRARAAAARHAARARRDADDVPVGQPRRADPRGRPGDGARGPRPRARRGRRRPARRRDDRARARPALRARVARPDDAGRRRGARVGDRRRARGRARGRRRQGGRRPRVGLRHGRRARARGSTRATSSSSATARTRSACALERGAALLVALQRRAAVRGDARARAAKGRERRRLAAGQLRDEPHDHAVGAVPRAHGPQSR